MHTDFDSPPQGRAAESRAGGRLLLLSAVVAALGSLLFGFDTAVISGTTEALRKTFALNDNLLGFTVSSALIGTMVGALGVGRPADWWGRRPVLTVLAVLFLISAARLRRSVELVCPSVFQVSGRCSRWRGIRRLPDVYHGNRSRQTARVSGLREPVEYRGRHSTGLLV